MGRLKARQIAFLSTCAYIFWLRLSIYFVWGVFVTWVELLVSFFMNSMNSFVIVVFAVEWNLLSRVQGNRVGIEIYLSVNAVTHFAVSELFLLNNIVGRMANTNFSYTSFITSSLELLKESPQVANIFFTLL